MDNRWRAIVPASDLGITQRLDRPNPRITRGLSMAEFVEATRDVKKPHRVFQVPDVGDSYLDHVIVHPDFEYVAVEYADYSGWYLLTLEGQPINELHWVHSKTSSFPEFARLHKGSDYQTNTIRWFFHDFRTSSTGWLITGYGMFIPDSYADDVMSPDVPVIARFTPDRVIFWASPDWKQLKLLGTTGDIDFDLLAVDDRPWLLDTFGEYEGGVVSFHRVEGFSLITRDGAVEFGDGSIGGPYNFPIEVGDSIYAISVQRPGCLTELKVIDLCDFYYSLISTEWQITDHIIKSLAAHKNFLLAHTSPSLSGVKEDDRVLVIRNGEILTTFRSELGIFSSVHASSSTVFVVDSFEGVIHDIGEINL